MLMQLCGLGYVCMCVGDVPFSFFFFFVCIPFFFFFDLSPPAVLHPYNKLRQCKLQFISWLPWVTSVLHRYSLQK